MNRLPKWVHWDLDARTLIAYASGVPEDTVDVDSVKKYILAKYPELCHYFEGDKEVKNG